MNRKFAIILAGGSGLRMGSAEPKQFLLLAGRPILLRTVEIFEAVQDKPNLLIVLQKNQMETWKLLCQQYGRDDLSCRLMVGGITRFHSVQNALSCINGEGVVAIHDGVRPLLSLPFVNHCFQLAEEHQAVIPVIPVQNSIRRIVPQEAASTDFGASQTQMVSRENLYQVQTPQVFDLELIRKAYTQAYLPEFTDDASVVEKMGATLYFTQGSPLNIKITTPDDLAIAQNLLNYCL